MVKVIKKNLSDKSQIPVYGLNRAVLSLVGHCNQELYNLRHTVYNNERPIDQKGQLVY